MFNVLVIDSGLGGASIVKRIREKCKNLNLTFYVENQHSPLGDLNQNQLIKLLDNIIATFQQKEKIDLLVLACNTITSACIKYLRKTYDFQVVGTEPNIKVKEGKTLVLGTKYTIKNCEILKSQPFEKLALPKLSKMIDSVPKNNKKIKNYLTKKLKKHKGVNNVICGCTHYYFVKDEISKILGKVKFFDAVEGVSNRVKELTCEVENAPQSLIIILSKNNTKKDKKLLLAIKDAIEN